MKIVRVIIGLFLVPCCLAVSRTVYFMVLALADCEKAAASIFWLAIGAGFCLWAAVFVFLPAPVKSYVLAHELTHVLWGYLMGASLRGMKISKSGGNVRLSESNFLVVLAPYFFPFYAMLVVGAYFLASVFVDLQKYFPFFLAAMGFTLGFHVCFTLSVLARRQSDIEQYGRFFSYTFIYYLNAFVVSLLIVMVSSVSLNQLVFRLAADFVWVWGYIGKFKSSLGILPQSWSIS